MLAAATFVLWAATEAGTLAHLLAVAAYGVAGAYVVAAAPSGRRVAAAVVTLGVTALGAGVLLVLAVVAGLPGAGVVTGVVMAALVLAGGLMNR